MLIYSVFLCDFSFLLCFLSLLKDFIVYRIVFQCDLSRIAILCSAAAWHNNRLYYII